MASIFSKIIAGEIPCHKVAESSDYVAFLDVGKDTSSLRFCTFGECKKNFLDVWLFVISGYFLALAKSKLT